jgi:hypothetical protein
MTLAARPARVRRIVPFDHDGILPTPKQPIV